MLKSRFRAVAGLLAAIAIVAGCWPHKTMAQSTGPIYGSFTLTAAGQRIPTLNLTNSIQSCGIVIYSGGGGFTLVPQVANDGVNGNPTPTWVTATSINGGSINAVGSSTGNVSNQGLSSFGGYLSALTSGTVTGFEICGAGTGGASAAPGTTPIPYPTDIYGYLYVDCPACPTPPPPSPAPTFSGGAADNGILTHLTNSTANPANVIFPTPSPFPTSQPSAGVTGYTPPPNGPPVSSFPWCEYVNATSSSNLANYQNNAERCDPLSELMTNVWSNNEKSLTAAETTCTNIFAGPGWALGFVNAATVQTATYTLYIDTSSAACSSNKQIAAFVTPAVAFSFSWPGGYYVPSGSYLDYETTVTALASPAPYVSIRE